MLSKVKEQNDTLKSENIDLNVKMLKLNETTVFLNNRIESLEQTIESDKLKYQTFVVFNNHQVLNFLVNDVKQNYDANL